MTVQILHLSDPHFGGLADIRQIEAVERMLPDLRPDAVVISGDMAQRARHGEFQRARAFVNLAESGADVVLCGHDHQEGADTLGGHVVVSTAGTLSTRSRGGRPSCFNFVTIEPAAVQVTLFRWDGERGRFNASDTFAFARGTDARAPLSVPS